MKSSPVTYEQIDEILIPWTKQKGLHIFAEYKETEIRGVNIVDDSGDIYSMGVFLQSSEPNAIKVAYGRDHPTGKTNRKVGSRMASLETLLVQLDSAWMEIESWIAERGHKRTPVL